MNTELAEARAALRTEKMQAYIQRVVAEAPPLTEAQRIRIGTMLRSQPKSEFLEPATLPTLREVLGG